MGKYPRIDTQAIAARYGMQRSASCGCDARGCSCSERGDAHASGAPLRVRAASHASVTAHGGAGPRAVLPLPPRFGDLEPVGRPTPFGPAVPAAVGSVDTSRLALGMVAQTTRLALNCAEVQFGHVFTRCQNCPPERPCRRVVVVTRTPDFPGGPLRERQNFVGYDCGDGRYPSPQDAAAIIDECFPPPFGHARDCRYSEVEPPVGKSMLCVPPAPLRPGRL